MNATLSRIGFRLGLITGIAVWFAKDPVRVSTVVWRHLRSGDRFVYRVG